jgi:hypothetical protein
VTAPGLFHERQVFIRADPDRGVAGPNVLPWRARISSMVNDLPFARDDVRRDLGIARRVHAPGRAAAIIGQHDPDRDAVLQRAQLLQAFGRSSGLGSSATSCFSVSKR